MYMHMGERLGPKLAEVLPGLIDRHPAPAMKAVVAYIPVLHEGYRRFLQAHPHPVHLIGPELYTDYRPLAKDIRALSAEEVAPALAAWGHEVHVLDAAAARELAAQQPQLTLPAEDVSYQVVERYFPRAEVLYDTAFLRWDKPRVVSLLATAAGPGDRRATTSRRSPRPRREQQHRLLAPGRRRDPLRRRHARSDAQRAPPAPSVRLRRRRPALELLPGRAPGAEHRDARGGAPDRRRRARPDASTQGAELYVTDFPCPPCAKLIAAGGIARVYYRTGYAVLDGEDVLGAAGVEIVKIAVNV